MTTKADDSYHRQWLHAMEDDRDVPGTAMQVGRVLADYAAWRGGRTVSVSWARLQRHTHRSTDAINEAIKYLIEHGWLHPHPRKRGQRACYDLTIGKPGTARRALRPAEHFESPDHSGQRSATTPASGALALRPAEHFESPDHSGQRSATTPASGALALRPAEYERQTSVTSLSRGLGALHAALSAVVPDVTERETQLALDEIKNQPGVRSATAIMRTEIRDGIIADRIANIRRAANPAQTTTTLPPLCGECDNRMIEDGQGRLRHCPNCHPAAIAKTREPQPI